MPDSTVKAAPGAIRKLLGLSRKTPKPEPTARNALDDKGFEVVRPRGKFGAVATTWAIRALVGLLLLSGLNQVVVKPLINASSTEDAQVSTAPVVDPDQVRQQAGRSAAEYLTKNGLRPDLVIPGALSDRTVLIQARVGDLWLPVMVPTDTTAVPVFSPDLPTSIPVISGEDPATTEATRDWAGDFLTAYAASDTTYLTTPGVDLQGLAGAVQFSELVSWQVSAADPNGLRTGTAQVTWTVGAATVQQTYVITLTSRDSRWYALAVSPSISTNA